MRTSAKRCIWTALLFSCLWYGFGIHEALCAESGAKASISKKPGADKPTAKALVEKLRAAQGAVTRSIIKSEAYTQWDNDYGNSPDTGKKDMHYLTEVRHDGRRYAVRLRVWGNVRKGLSESHPGYTTYLCDGTRTYLIMYQPSEPPEEDVVSINDKPYPGEKGMSGAVTEMYLRGFYANVDENVEAVLAGALSLKVRDKPERIGESDCHVLEADTKYGRYVVWVDPAHGYNVAKAEVFQGEGDLYGARNMPLPPGVTQHFVLENVRFAEMNGVWVPMECETRLELKAPDGTSKSVSHHKRTEVKLNPDFDALGSFLPEDIREGATTFVAPRNMRPGGPMVRCVWHNGKPVPVDSGGQRKGKGKDNTDKRGQTIQRPGNE